MARNFAFEILNCGLAWTQARGGRAGWRQARFKGALGRQQQAPQREQQGPGAGRGSAVPILSLAGALLVSSSSLLLSSLELSDKKVYEP